MQTISKRLLSVILVLTMLVTLMAVPAGATEVGGSESDQTAVVNNGEQELASLSGSGTAEDPFLIATIEELILFRDSVNAGETTYNAEGIYVALAANIDLSSIENWEPIGTFDYSFDGNFDGQNHTIMNLKMSDSTAAGGYAYLGFFGVTANNTIKNFTIENVTISSNGQIVAAAIAYPYYTAVHNITVCGDIAIKGGNYTAGVLAYTRLCTNASNLTVNGNDGSYITGAITVGGVIADIQLNYGLTADYSKFTAKNVTITGSKCVGGISGIICLQTLDGATVENVTLNCTDAHVGIVAGSLGDTSVVKNVTTSNVTGATAIVGGLYNSDTAAAAAKIGDTYYKSFAAAYAAAAEGDTITLLAPIVVAAGETLTLDKAVTIAYASAVPGEDMITVRGTLNVAAGKLTYFNDSNGTNVTVSTISAEPGSVVNITGGTVENKCIKGDSSYPYAIDLLTNGNLGNVTVSISGGTITSDYMAIRQFNNGTACKNTLTITGGYIYGAKRAVQIHMDNNAAYTTISGGKVESEGYSLCFMTSAGENVSVTGGEFIGAVYSGTNAIISGGTFNEAPYSGYIADGMEAVKNDDGVYEVVSDSILPGSGTAEDPYLIRTVKNLISFRDSVNAGETTYNAEGIYVALAANIDLSSIENWEPIGTFDYSFDGNFDGQNHTIMNLKMSDSTAAGGYAYLGFFGVTANNTIKNFTIENVTISSNGQIVAAAIAYPYYTAVHNITVCGDIAIKGGNYTAGVLAYTRLCTNASNLTVNGNDGSYITGAITVGGVIADIQLNYGLTADYSKFTAKNVTITGSKCVGGISGIICLQTLDGATVENVTLNCTDAHVGIVAGSLGDTSVVKNVTTSNVTGATAIVGGLYNSDTAAAAAKIGDTYYKSFAAAYAAAAEGDTITLLAPIVVAAGETLTLDKAVTIAYASAVPGEDMITVRGTLNVAAGKLTYFNDSNGTNVTVSTISAEPGSVVNITGGTVENKCIKGDSSYPYAIDLLTNGNLGNVTVSISGGTITSDYMAIRQFNNGTACKNTLTITGGYIYGAKRAVQIHMDNNAAYTTISGGKVESEGYSLCFMTSAGENVSVTGGEFIGTVYSGTNAIISGGTFNEAPYSGYIADGYCCGAAATGYVVGEHTVHSVAGTDSNCTDNGTKDHYTCDRCSKLYEDELGENELTSDDIVVPAYGHNFDNLTHHPMVEESCTVAGLAEYYSCDCCGKFFGYSLTENAFFEIPTLADIVLPAEGHKYLDGICLICQALDPKYTPALESVTVANGETATVAVAIVGDKLTYQWYYKNDGQTSFYKTNSFKGNTYYIPMTADRDGRQVYCVITDAYGNSVKSAVATLSMMHEAEITGQPESVKVASGATVKVNVAATGDGLTYTWYYKNAGASAFTKSAVKVATYSTAMTSTVDGRQIYCVVTDAYGNSVTSDIATLTMMHEVEIIVQPESVTAAPDATAKVSVTATGDGLTYTWYFKNKNASSFNKTSSFKGNTYYVAMDDTRDGRQVYCVITDAYGNSVKTDIVTLTMANVVKITSQPKDVVAADGATFKTTVAATGDGLTYTWYYKNAGASAFAKSSIKKATYTTTMNSTVNGRQVYCVVTDAYGNSVTSDVITLTMGNVVKITSQPKDVVAANGATFRTTVAATGDGLTYTWYYKNAGASTYAKSSIKKATYTTTMNSAVAGRQVYCVITDAYGNSVQTNVVTLNIK